MAKALLLLLLAPATRAQLDGWALATVPVVTGIGLEQALIARQIALLGDDAFRTREGASRMLVVIGRPALPALRAALRSPDAEVSRRAGAAIGEIFRRIEQDPELPEAVLARAEGLKRDLEASGQGMPQPLTQEWLVRQEGLVRAADRLLSQEAGGLGPEEVSVRLAAFRGGSLPESISFQSAERNRQALIFLSEAAASARLTLARAYSLSDDPKQRALAIDALIQVIRLSPDGYMNARTPARLPGRIMYEDFRDIAVRAGARNNQAFIDALPPASRDELLDRLRQLETPPE